MSSVPTGSVVPSIWAIFAARRWARLTPRVRRPTKARSLAPPFFSRISWEIRVRARSRAVSSRTCAFSRWRGAALLIFSPCGPLRARLKESSRTDFSYSTWRSSLVSTRARRMRPPAAPALDGPLLSRDGDPAGLHHEPPRRHGHHDLFHPLAVPYDEVGPAADGAAVVAQVEDTRRIARDSGHQLAHELARAHVSRDGADERQVRRVGGADRRERVADVVGRERDRNAGLQQAADRRQAATDVALVATSHQVEIGQRQTDHADPRGRQLRDQGLLLGSRQRRQLGQMADGDPALPARPD